MDRRAGLPYRAFKLRASFWFIPGVLAVVAFLAAAASLWLDAHGASDFLRPLGTPFSIHSITARELLSTLAGATVTVVSLVFSLTLVTLTLAAGNLGARLLERYMQNRVTQVTMGLFSGTFVYTVVVLSSVGTHEEGVPRLSVVLALVFSLGSVGWLMYAFHDLARSIQVDQASAAISRSLRMAIEGSARQFRGVQPDRDDEIPTDSPRAEITSRHSGYIEAIDWDLLGEAARDHGVVLDIYVSQGAYLTRVDALAAVYGAADPDPALVDRVREAVTIGPERTEADDLMFLVHLLVEIACRALSPGTNDLYTALACADHLIGSFVHALEEGLERVTVRDDDGRLLVRTRSADVALMANTVLSTLRRNGMNNTTFALRLIRNLERLAPLAAKHPTAPLILGHLERIADHAALGVPRCDAEALEAAAERVREAFRRWSAEVKLEGNCDTRPALTRRSNDDVTSDEGDPR